MFSGSDCVGLVRDWSGAGLVWCGIALVRDWCEIGQVLSDKAVMHSRIDMSVSESVVAALVGQDVSRGSAVLMLGRSDAVLAGLERAGYEVRVERSLNDLPDVAFDPRSPLQFGAVVYCDVDAVELTAFAMRKLYCLVQPGGVIVVSLPNRERLRCDLKVAPLRILSAAGAPWMSAGRSPCTRDYGASVSSSLASDLGIVAREWSHQLRKTGFDVLDAGSRGFGPFSMGRRRLPRPVSDVVGWGMDRVAGLGGAGRFLEYRGNICTILARKPDHAGYSGRSDVTPSLGKAIHGFEVDHAAEFDRLRVWLGRNGDVVDRAVPRSDVEAVLRRCGSVVVISPHPDDELIGCGGLLLDCVDRGCRVSIVQVTDGADSQGLAGACASRKRHARSAEARRVADAMGAASVVTMELSSESLRCVGDHARELADVLVHEKPDVILTPFIHDNHADHVAANQLLLVALDLLDDALHKSIAPLVLSYEVWSFLPPIYVHPVDHVVQRKMDLFMLYPIAMEVVDYVWYCQKRDGFHSLRHLHRSGFAEAYFPLECAAYMSMVRSMVRPMVRCVGEPAFEDAGAG